MRILAKVFFLLLPFITVSCIIDKDEPASSLAAGDAVPEFEVMMSDGSMWTSGMLAGKVGVIVFFNTGCADCRRELPILQQVYESVGNPVEFICIAREERGETIEAYWRSHGLTMPYSPQEDRKVYEMFASFGIPRIYVTDPDMRIYAGFSDAEHVSAQDIEAAVIAASASRGAVKIWE